MSLPKAQLVDPQGNMNLPGMTATGVVTATSLKGDIAGSATALAGITDLDVGIVTASSFVGQGDGHAANITGTPQLNLGITTATSFVGDATGKAAGLTGTPNLNVGLITATSFVGFVTGNVTGTVSGDVTGNITGNISGDVEGNVTGNVSGLARGLGINGTNVWTGAGTSNLGVGVCTALELYGDGSGLVGAGSSAYIAQEVNAVRSETIIDLSYGNVIYYKGIKTTVGFASTSAAEQITFVRESGISTFNAAYNESFGVGGVTFDGTGDYLTTGSSSEFSMGTGDFTVECLVKYTATPSNAGIFQISSTSGGFTNSSFNSTISVWTFGGVFLYNATDGDGAGQVSSGVSHANDVWYHIALVRASSVTKLYINGVEVKSNPDTANYNGTYIGIGGYWSSTYVMTGQISNFRVVKGTAVYTSNFVPPNADLTNITGTGLLCCQSTSSTTAKAVGPTITANGDPAAGSLTVAYSGTNTITNSIDSDAITWPDRVKWNNDTTPTLLSSTQTNAAQLFRFTTVDTGLNYNGWEEITTGENSTLFSWGNNTDSVLGLNDTANRSSPTQVGTDTSWARLLFKGASTGIYDISGAIKTDGTLWVWGDNVEGELGLNDKTDRSSPTQIPGSWSTGSTGGHGQGSMSCIKTNGTLWAWGTQQHGSLGLNTPHDSQVSSPTQVGTNANWSKVRLSKENGMGSKTDGTLWIWGHNERGQLGQNAPTNSKKSSPTQIPGTWSDNFDIGDAVACSAVKADGTLWSWGSQSDGQLGQNEQSSPSKRGYSSPVQVGTDTTWGGAKVAHGSQSFGYVKTDGTLWMIGRNNYGKLGINAGTDSRSSPVQLPGTTWASISGSYTHCIASKTDNTMWVWGSNNHGAFGMSDPVAVGQNRSSPIQLPGNWNAQGEDQLAADYRVSQALKATT